MTQQITRTMTIEEIFQRFSSKSQKLAQEMSRMGLQCVGCGAATWETLEAGMYSHGFSDVDIDNLIEKLNRILKEPLPKETIVLTEKAALYIQKIFKEEGKEGWALRFGDRPGGCSGYEYILDFSQSPAENDEVFHSYGIDIHVNKARVPFLIGCEIDYVEGLQSGFQISNPNAKGSCGCGNSQTY